MRKNVKNNVEAIIFIRRKKKILTWHRFSPKDTRAGAVECVKMWKILCFKDKEQKQILELCPEVASA